MVETISLKQFSIQEKLMILRELDCKTDGKFVLDSNGAIMKDQYIDEPIQIERMIILPGSTVILDDNDFSISSYIEEYGDRF